MDVRRIIGWAYDTGSKLAREDPVGLDRLLSDIRTANFPADLSLKIAENALLLSKRVQIGEIPQELRHFETVTDFKDAKAALLITLFNVRSKKEKKEGSG